MKYILIQKATTPTCPVDGGQFAKSYTRDLQTLHYESRKASFCSLEYSRELAYGG